MAAIDRREAAAAIVRMSPAALALQHRAADPGIGRRTAEGCRRTRLSRSAAMPRGRTAHSRRPHDHERPQHVALAHRGARHPRPSARNATQAERRRPHPRTTIVGRREAFEDRRRGVKASGRNETMATATSSRCQGRNRPGFGSCAGARATATGTAPSEAWCRRRRAAARPRVCRSRRPAAAGGLLERGLGDDAAGQRQAGERRGRAGAAAARRRRRCALAPSHASTQPTPRNSAPLASA